jgi:hypothetical protein
MDPRSTDGLLDLTMLGNLLEFSQYLDRRHRTGNIPSSEQGEIEFIQRAFAGFKDLFCANHHLMVGERMVDPRAELFDLSLIQFAVTLVRCKANEALFQDSNGTFDLKRTVSKHLSIFHSQLLPHFKKDILRPQADLVYLCSFDWMGPEFTVAEGAYASTSSRTDSGSLAVTLGPTELSIMKRHQRGMGAHKRSFCSC